MDWQERLDILRQVKLDHARRKRQMDGTAVFSLWVMGYGLWVIAVSYTHLTLPTKA